MNIINASACLRVVVCFALRIKRLYFRDNVIAYPNAIAFVSSRLSPAESFRGCYRMEERVRETAHRVFHHTPPFCAVSSSSSTADIAFYKGRENGPCARFYIVAITCRCHTRRDEPRDTGNRGLIRIFACHFSLCSERRRCHQQPL